MLPRRNYIVDLSLRSIFQSEETRRDQIAAVAINHDNFWTGWATGGLEIIQGYRAL